MINNRHNNCNCENNKTIYPYTNNTCNLNYNNQQNQNENNLFNPNINENNVSNRVYVHSSTREVPGPKCNQGEPGGINVFANFYSLMPPNNTTTVALTITPVAGGNESVSAHLTIIKLS